MQQDNTNPLDDLSEAELRTRVHQLQRELDQARSSGARQLRRRTVIRGGVVAATLGALGIYGVGSAAADPQGVYPVESDDPFEKIRADRIRYVSRTSQPSAPSSGRVISYVDDGDLP